MKIKLIIFLLIVSAESSLAQFSRTFDRYENVTTLTYNTPFVNLYKYIKNQDTTYQIAFCLYDTYLTASGSGAILLFSDNEKIELEGDVEVAHAQKGYYRYTFYSFDQGIFEKLSNTSLLGYKLHIFSKDLNLQNRNLILNAAKKILSSK